VTYGRAIETGGFAYVGNPSPACIGSGCQVRGAEQTLLEARMAYAAAERMLEQARQLAGRNEKGEPVSQALWCDAGEHAFSGRDPKAERWDRTMKNAENETVTIPWDVCGECLGGMGTPGFGLRERHAIMTGENGK
jgi:hypothetical protein